MQRTAFNILSTSDSLTVSSHSNDRKVIQQFSEGSSSSEVLCQRISSISNEECQSQCSLENEGVKSCGASSTFSKEKRLHKTCFPIY